MKKLLQTWVPTTAHRQATKLAKGHGVSCAAWLRQIIMVATQDNDAGRQVRSLVMQSLMAPERMG